MTTYGLYQVTSPGFQRRGLDEDVQVLLDGVRPRVVLLVGAAAVRAPAG